MGYLFTIFAPLVLLVQDPLHSALTPSPKELEAAWRTGVAHARKDKTPEWARRLARRTLSGGKPTSHVTFLHPRLVAFEDGFTSRKRDPIDSRTEAERLSLFAEEGQHRLSFHVELGIYPHGFHGANPSDLQDVHAELVVGSRVYAPVQQPGILAAQRNDVDYWESQPVYSTRTYKDSNGCDQTETTVDYVQERVHYTWYKGEFALVFDARDPDGTPRIKNADEEIKVAVTGKFGRQIATFRLKDWQKAFNK